jgi:hypothetical protein
MHAKCIVVDERWVLVTSATRKRRTLGAGEAHAAAFGQAFEGWWNFWWDAVDPTRKRV